MGTQWIVREGFSGPRYQGLNYQALDSVEARMPPDPSAYVPPPRELFAQLRILEREALEHLNPRG